MSLFHSLTHTRVHTHTCAHTVMDRSWLRASVRGDCSNQSSGERDKGENNECGIRPFIAQQKATGSDRHTQCGEERKGGEEEREKREGGMGEGSAVKENKGWTGEWVCKYAFLQA